MIRTFTGEFSSSWSIYGSTSDNFGQLQAISSLSGAPFVLVTAYGDRDDVELQDRLNVWKSFFLDARFESSKLDEMVNRSIMKISFLTENQIERLLAESGFTKYN
jgi:hypothetical protein